MIRNQYPIQRHPNGKISVNQHIINSLEISYNPDDNRFHVSKEKDLASIRTFANNKKGYANALYWMRKQERNKD